MKKITFLIAFLLPTLGHTYTYNVCKNIDPDTCFEYGTYVITGDQISSFLMADSNLSIEFSGEAYCGGKLALSELSSDTSQQQLLYASLIASMLNQQLSKVEISFTKTITNEDDITYADLYEPVNADYQCVLNYIKVTP